MFKKSEKTRAAKSANHVPAFDTDVPSILAELGQRLNLFEAVFAGLLQGATHRESPILQIDSRIVHIVVIDGKLIDGREVCVGKGEGVMSADRKSTRLNS